MAVSERGHAIISEENILFEGWSKTIKNAFDSKENPDGIINLGTSENKLVFDLLQEKFNDAKAREIEEADTRYCDYKGLQFFRKALAEFLGYYMKPVEAIIPDNIVVQSGCGSVLANLGRVLCNPGESVLTPSPLYGGFYQDFGLYDVGIFPIPLTKKLKNGEIKPFELSILRVEAALEKAKESNITIRAILLANPNNPLGNIYPESIIRECLDFAHKHSLHVIIDEIYLLSIFKEGAAMKSVLSFDNIPDKQRLHVVWGFSKDFGISGFRCGMVYSLNQKIINALDNFSYFFSVPTPVQRLLLPIITDKEWVNKFIRVNHSRLRKSYNILSEGLKSLGIHHLESEAGFFMWVDFREFLSVCSREEEIKLYHRFIDEGCVYLSPCCAFFSEEFGWFRIIFANDPEVLKIALQRLKKFVEKIRSKEN